MEVLFYFFSLILLFQNLFFLYRQNQLCRPCKFNSACTTKKSKIQIFSNSALATNHIIFIFLLLLFLLFIQNTQVNFHENYNKNHLNSDK